MSLCHSDTQERANVTLCQAPVCVSCMTDKAELVYSDVLKGLDSDLRLFRLLSVSCYLHTHIWIHWDSLCMPFYSLALSVVSVLLSIVICLSCSSSDLPFFPDCTFLS